MQVRSLCFQLLVNLRTYFIILNIKLFIVFYCLLSSVTWKVAGGHLTFPVAVVKFQLSCSDPYGAIAVLLASRSPFVFMRVHAHRLQNNSRNWTNSNSASGTGTNIYIQGVSEIRVLILTSGRTRQITELLSITFLRKSNTNWFKIWNQLTIKVYTRLWVRAKIFGCDKNRALLKSSIVIEKNK
jgi:hypothetical protein